MAIVKIIIGAILHGLTYFLFEYCFDEPKFEKFNVKDMKMPSVRDLEDGSPIYQIDDYVKNVVCPANHFFILLKHMDRNGDSSASIFSLFFIQASSLLLVVYGLFDFLNAEGTLIRLLIIVISIIALVLICVFVNFLYKKTNLYIKVCKGTEESIKDFRTEYRSNYGISETDEINNYLIRHYLKYLLKIENSMNRRMSFSTVYNYISVIFFFIDIIGIQYRI